MILTILFIVFCSYRVQAQCGGYVGSLDFAAAAPYTFNHKTGGGAWNQKEIGDHQDVVESLQGGDWACGDWVSYMLNVKMNTFPSGTKKVDLTLELTYLADTTGQSGVAFTDFNKVQLNYGNVTNGNRPSGMTITPPKYLTGLDNGVIPSSINCQNPQMNVCNGPNIKTVMTCTECSGAPTVVVNKKWYDNPNAAPVVFTAGTNLKLSVTIKGLSSDQTVVLRTDVLLSCLIGIDKKPTGNLGATITTATCTYGGGATEAVSAGNQNVPLQSVADIQGIGVCVPPNITGVDFNGTVMITNPNQVNGGATLNNFWYSWSKGGFLIKGITTNYTEMHTYDSKCTPNQAGLLEYNQGACGCEITTITSDQPRFFLYNASEYYSKAGSGVWNGVAYDRYVNITEGPVLELWLLAGTTTPFIAKLTDGRVFQFSNIQYGTVPTTLFTQYTPSNTSACACNRIIDVVLLMERSVWVSTSAWTNVVTFATNILKGFTISATRVNVGVIWYDSAVKTELAVSDGNSLTNVVNALRGISCAGGGAKSCGTATAPVIYDAFVAAKAALDASRRQASTTAKPAKAIIYLGTGAKAIENDLHTYITSLVNTYSIMTVSGIYNNIDIYSDLAYQLAPTESRWLLPMYTSDRLTLAAASTYYNQLIGLVCLASKTPCGSACCGGCDSTCGQCYDVTSCIADNSNCSAMTVVKNGCCAKIADTCPTLPCSVGVCNAASGKCQYTSSCPANNTCYFYTCENSACKQNPKFTNDNYCTTTRCSSTGTIETVSSGVCPDSDACNTVTCDESSRSCKSTPVPNNYTTNNCLTNLCNPASGWTVPVNKTAQCQGADLCQTYTCDLNTGLCKQTPVCPAPAVEDKCNTQYCDNGVCKFNNTVKTACESQAATNLCFSFTCVPSTGACLVTPKIASCPSLDGCNDYKCNNGTGACTAVTSKICNCNCKNDICQFSTCDASNNCNLSTRVNTTCTAPDYCSTVGPCVVPTGCPAAVPVTCPAANACEDLVRDPTNPKCCVYTPKTCPQLGPCYSPSTCDNTTGCSTPNYLCPTSTNCTLHSCESTGCAQTSKNCTARSACETASCSESGGGCVYSPLSCDDQDPCTIDTCDDSLGCQHSNMVCDDNDKCTKDTCVGGSCRFDAEAACDDGLNCTTDSCDPATGSCTFTPDNSFCSDANPCKVWTCDKTATPAANPTGCVATDFICPTSEDKCSIPQCVDFQGCGFSSKSCNTTGTADCSLVTCNATDGNCTTKHQACATIDTVTIVAASLTAAAVVGIVIAVIACLGLTGGATFAAYSKLSDSDMASIHNNPLWQDNTKGGANPLHQDGGGN